MSTAGARYVRLRDQDADLARLRTQFGDGAVQSVPESSFAIVLVTTPSLQPDDLAALSRDFGEALSLQTQTIADLLVYDHFVAGARVRGLTYAGEAGWQRVFGEREPWEAQMFFSSTRLEELLLELDDETKGSTTLQRDSAELRRLWSKARLEEGNPRPTIELRTVTRAIVAHFGLPGLPVGRPSSGKQRIP